MVKEPMATEVDRDAARQIARRTLGDLPDVAIDEAQTVETEHCWVFFWNSREFVESRDPMSGLFGNAPIIVSKHDGSLVDSGSAQPAEHYVRRYERRLRRRWWRFW